MTFDLKERLTELRKLLKPSQRVTSKHLPVRRRQRADLVRAGEDEVVLRRLGGLPLLAILRHEDAKLVPVVDDLHVRRVVEVGGVRGGAKEQLAGCLREAVEAGLGLLAGFVSRVAVGGGGNDRRGAEAEAGQQP